MHMFITLARNNWHEEVGPIRSLAGRDNSGLLLQCASVFTWCDQTYLTPVFQNFCVGNIQINSFVLQCRPVFIYITFLWLVALVINHQSSCIGWQDNWWIGKHLEGSRHGLNELLFWNSHRTEKNHENLVKIASDPADIPTEYLTSTRLRALPLDQSAELEKEMIDEHVGLIVEKSTW